MSADSVTPIIGIIPGLVSEEEIVRLRDNYCQAIVRAGGAPMIFPVVESLETYEKLLPIPDAFLLTGGSDIDPQRYASRIQVYEPKRYAEDDARSTVTEPSPRRDKVEDLVLNYAFTHDMPLLGICRGFQMINVHFGGTLYQDVSEQMEAQDPEALMISHWQGSSFDRPTHTVSVQPGSQLADFLNAATLNVNSMHHQGIRDLAPCLKAVAYAPDGLVEALEHPAKKFIMGVQWHPEFLRDSMPQRRLFNAFVQYAIESHHERQSLNSLPAEGPTLRISPEGDGLEAWGHAAFHTEQPA